MAFEEFKSNSNRSKESPQENRKIESVVSGSAKVKQKSEMQKFANVFISEDVQNVKSYIFMDVFVPTIKRTILEILEMIFYGSSGTDRRRSPGSRIDYGRSFVRANERREREQPRQQRTSMFEDIIFDTRGDALEVLSSMDEIVSQYGVVRVAEMYSLAGITMNHNHTLENYGWTDISRATVVSAGRDGYIIKLPKAMPLN